MGAFAEHVAQLGAAERGDPAKAARIIVRLANEAEPPRRILLGVDAVSLAATIAAGRAAEDAKWREVSVSTDFDNASSFEASAMGKHVLAVKQP